MRFLYNDSMFDVRGCEAHSWIHDVQLHLEEKYN